MPTNTTGDFLPLLDAFLAHWSQVNAVPNATTLTLKGGYARADLSAARDTLQSAQVPVQAAVNVQQRTAGRRDELKAALMPIAKQFRAAVRDRLSGTPYERALPTLPRPTAPQNAFLKPLDDMADVWQSVNADATLTDLARPLTLPGGVTLTQFAGLLMELKSAYTAMEQADAQAKLARARRDSPLPSVRARLLEYRRAIAGRFVPTEPLVTALPALSPPPRARKTSVKNPKTLPVAA